MNEENYGGILLDFSKPETISYFIRNQESGIYRQSEKANSENVLSRYIIVEKDEGLICCTVYKSKPKFIECVAFNKDGYEEELYYEPAV